MSARHGKQNRVVRVYFDVLLCFSASLDELPLCLTVYTKPAKKEEGYPHLIPNVNSGIKYSKKAVTLICRTHLKNGFVGEIERISSRGLRRRDDAY